MMSVDQLKHNLKHQKIKNLSQETGVSEYNLRRMRSGDRTVPYNEMEKVSDYFEGKFDEE